jgi:hypothetical protein
MIHRFGGGFLVHTDKPDIYIIPKICICFYRNIRAVARGILQLAVGKIGDVFENGDVIGGFYLEPLGKNDLVRVLLEFGEGFDRRTFAVFERFEQIYVGYNSFIAIYFYLCALFKKLGKIL